MIFFGIIAVIVVIFFGAVVFIGAPYVPSQRKYVKRAFESLYKVGPKDILVDVGSGDGVVLRIAAAYGAKAIGYEINPFLVLLSRLLAGRNQNVKTHWANFWQVELPADTTVVYAFAVSRDGRKLARKMQREANRLNKGLVLLCHGSPLDLKPTQTFDAYYRYQFNPLHPDKSQV